VTSTISDTVAPAATIAAPVAEIADRAVTKVLAPVVTVIDTVVDVVTDSVGPVLGVLPRAATGDAAIAATASLVSPHAAAAISGTAIGVWFGSIDPLGGTAHVSGTTAAGIALPAAALGFGFLVLLFSRRLSAVNTALPVSPVYETDTSPD
jgi:hypothetical protein